MFSNPQDTPLSALLNFGNQVLVLTEDGRYLHVWGAETGDLDASIVFDDGFTATHIIHPATMLNKVLVASAEGSMQLWNIRTRYISLIGFRESATHIWVFSCTSTLLHRFDPEKLCEAATNSPCAITALVQSHVVDVVGIGFSNGETSIYDIRQDVKLFRVRMDGGAIRALSFRTGDHSKWLKCSKYNL
jgi:U3 small nucleolar RNA-associated protein 21